MLQTPRARTIMWFRRDLRLADNEALTAAAETGDVLCVWVETRPHPRRDAPAQAEWRHASLSALAADLEAAGSRLYAVPGPAETALPVLAAALGVARVFCSRDHDPVAVDEEHRVAAALGRAGAALDAREGQLLVPPGTLVSGSGRAFRVFTAYHRRWQSAWRPEPPLAVPARLATVPPRVLETATARLRLQAVPAAREARPPLRGSWEPGERAAALRLRRFAEAALPGYAATRDLPSLDGTSMLSPRLALGELSARSVAWEAMQASGEAAEPFVRQLAWRDFSYDILWSFPELDSRPWRPEFAAMPWREDEEALDAWTEGRTGYPLVDAGMRQLAATGWMHNRVRLVAASFLVKDLLLPWQLGESHFRQTLIDYDPASNAFNWQWVAGSGADAAPYFRIFSPDRQTERFDPNGDYARMWVPELRLAATAAYSTPIVDHQEARVRALAALSVVRDAGSR